MPERVTHEDMMRFIDGEMPPDEHARMQGEIEASTELQREVALYRALKADVQDLSFDTGNRHDSVWEEVNRQLTRPVGWAFLVVGVLIWAGYGIWVFTHSPGNPIEKLATAAVVIGVLLLLASVIWERYRDWLVDPYRNVYR